MKIFHETHSQWYQIKSRDGCDSEEEERTRKRRGDRRKG